MEAIVVGGTGLVGSSLIEELSNSSRYTKIITIGRKASDCKSPKILNLLVNDLSEISKIELSSKDAVFFCCLGSTIKKSRSKENFRKVDYNGVVDFARLAKKADAKKLIVVSAKGADPRSSFFYNKTKGEAEQTIKSIGLKSVTVYRPGLLLGDREEFRFFELLSIIIVKGLKSFIRHDQLRPIVTTVNELAKAMVDDSLVTETGYKIVDSSEIKK